ncbi:MAG: DUF2938 domain-containing protein [Gammaproteobacteria bacterium]|nr:DUF2938 domain-containing protein [Gammaproteobacteria bacterium]
MEILGWAFLGGIVGAILMDITEHFAGRLGVTSGVSVGLVGRWFLGLLRGRFAYNDIQDSLPHRHEVKAGWVFHFLVGGGGVALVYPLVLQASGVSLAINHLLGGVVFGLATSILPWFILLPSFGWGVFGRQGPQGSNALLASTLSHIPYGLGVGGVIAIGLS